MYKKVIFFISIIFNILFLTGCSMGVQGSNNLKNVNSNIIEQKDIGPTLKETIQKLCSDDCNGRLCGSKGNELAQKYIIDNFKAIGLEDFNGDFVQEYNQEVSDTYGEITKETEVKNKKIKNVIAKIPGINSKKAIFISAHFDHIGKQNSKIIKGAVDNASGVAVLIQLASDLKKYADENKFNYDIVFCAFNGEEEGLQGSRNFIKENKNIYNEACNINIDSIGYKNGGNIIFLNKNEKYESLYNKFKSVFEKNDVKICDENIKGISDNKSFEEGGIPNICIIDKDVKNVIHTPQDTPELIDYKQLEMIKKSLFEYIVEYGYK